MTMSGGGPPAGGGAGAGAPLAAPTLVEVTIPRRNTISGLGSYTIKSSTYDPRSSKY